MYLAKLVKRVSGFTLIELLIVVAIIAILAAIAVPNFLEAQTRAKVSRVQADQRSVVTALETFTLDKKTYPKSNAYMLPKDEKNSTQQFRGFLSLTTPVAYMTSIPTDPFNPKVGGNDGGQPNLRLYTGNEGNADGGKRTFYVLMSVGPAAVRDDTSSSRWGRDLNDIKGTNKIALVKVPAAGAAMSSTSWGIPYDPTNGTTSEGGIYKTGGSSAISHFLCAGPGGTKPLN
ncbi:MAG TPA: prepilin-type N-terminal cleavage/methylation domain-containing protein [Candidatus Sumerlaeota bacterium]|nr:prepilin-type N-terminal cleavage/methylation domain-containing protein [Candidatus Sumerlaeota bacterium]HPS01489.1 prepilin-type N-terminal cleavage/methylation domain-containing protein [Candidatus Sumerlaeota bacterium]